MNHITLSTNDFFPGDMIDWANHYIMAFGYKKFTVHVTTPTYMGFDEFQYISGSCRAITLAFLRSPKMSNNMDMCNIKEHRLFDVKLDDEIVCGTGRHGSALSNVSPGQACPLDLMSSRFRLWIFHIWWQPTVILQSKKQLLCKFRNSKRRQKNPVERISMKES